MSRSFIVRTDKDIKISLIVFMERLKNLDLFDVTELKIWYEGNEIDLDYIYKQSLTLNNRHTCFAIDDSLIHISYHDDSPRKWWYIESRALDGIARSLFVATASIIADLSDGLANSADGAWHDPDKMYHGIELWEEYLNIELNRWNSDLCD